MSFKDNSTSNKLQIPYPLIRFTLIPSRVQYPPTAIIKVIQKSLITNVLRAESTLCLVETP